MARIKIGIDFEKTMIIFYHHFLAELLARGAQRAVSNYIEPFE